MDGAIFPPLPFLSAKFLRAALPRCPNPGAWSGPLRIAATRYGIADAARMAMFVAQCGHESGDFCRLRESLDYSPAGLIATWPTRFNAVLAQRLGRTAAHPANQPAIAEVAYGGRLGNSFPGDAWRYRGAGLIQVTGFSNHDKIAQAFNLPTEEVPEWLTTPNGAALGAAYWWDINGLNAFADAGDIEGATRKINGGLIGLADRRARYRRALDALG